MRRLAEWCDEASVAHWTQESAALPDWIEVHRRMQIRLDRIPEMPAELKDVIREQNDSKLPEELA